MHGPIKDFEHDRYFTDFGGPGGSARWINAVEHHELVKVFADEAEAQAALDKLISQGHKNVAWTQSKPKVIPPPKATPEISVLPGNVLPIKLPSGRVLQLEETADTFSIYDPATGQVFFSEEKAFNELPNDWRQTFPSTRLEVENSKPAEEPTGGMAPMPSHKPAPDLSKVKDWQSYRQGLKAGRQETPPPHALASMQEIANEFRSDPSVEIRDWKDLLVMLELSHLEGAKGPSKKAGDAIKQILSMKHEPVITATRVFRRKTDTKGGLGEVTPPELKFPFTIGEFLAFLESKPTYGE